MDIAIPSARRLTACVNKGSGRRKNAGSRTSEVPSNAEPTAFVTKGPDPPGLTDLLCKLRTFDALRDSVVDGRRDKVVFGCLPSSPPAFAADGYMEQVPKLIRKHLRLVIIDEIHEYRGYFGTNVALLLRRFFARLHQIGSHPQVVLATATCGNAKEHAYRITGRQCTLIHAQTAMRPERHFAFIDPDIPDFRFHEIYRLRIARAALACVAQGLSTLIFCPSRKFAEEAAMRAKADAEQLGINPETIAPYRSGYEADLRREIEDGLRTGRFQAVFTTNALEIGIDIGRLDACILAGFPDSVLSAWQRIGRVGRSFHKPAYVLFYAFNNAFDRFFASNIDAFLNKPLDEILIGVDNEELMSKHLPYLVHEAGPNLTEDLRDQLGAPFLDFARKAMVGKKPVQSRGPNYFRLSIRGGSGTTWRLMYKGKEIGTISDTHLFREGLCGGHL